MLLEIESFRAERIPSIAPRTNHRIIVGTRLGWDFARKELFRHQEKSAKSAQTRVMRNDSKTYTIMHRRPGIIRHIRDMSRIAVLHDSNHMISYHCTDRWRLWPQPDVSSTTTERVEQDVRTLRVSEHDDLGRRAAVHVGGQLSRHCHSASRGALVVGEESGRIDD